MSKNTLIRLILTLVSLICTVVLGLVTNFASEEIRNFITPFQGNFGWIFIAVTFILIVTTTWYFFLENRQDLTDRGGYSQKFSEDRRTMLASMKNSWVREFLELRLAEFAKIHLRFKDDPKAVNFRLRKQVQEIGRAPRLLPDNKSIRQIFDEFQGSLLILGAPGSGKTTVLAELTRSLIITAEKERSYPIPVIFSLSSWAAKRRRIKDWLIEELIETYEVPEHLAKHWTNRNMILPLLDGLDEVAEPLRNACVEAINQYKASLKNFARIVVTSRSSDYELLTQTLNLRGAITVQPLTDTQIQTYLNNLREDTAGLQQALKEDIELKNLATTPLMLSVMVLAFNGRTSRELHLGGNIDDKRSLIFDEYIDEMFRRRGQVANYGIEDTKGWLAWLAYQMKRHDTVDFLIERIQPSWLPNRSSQLIYVFISRLACSYLLAATLAFTVLSVAWKEFLFMGLFSGITIGLIDSFFLLRRGVVYTENKLSQILQIFIVWVCTSLVLGLLFGFTKDSPLQDKFLNTLAITGFSLGLFTAGFFSVLFGLRGSKQTIQHDIQPVERLRWSSSEAISGALNYSIGFSIIFAVIATAIWHTGGRGSEWVTSVSNETLGWLFDAINISIGLPRVLCFAVVLGFLFGCVLGATIQGLRYGIIDREKTRLNEGMQLSLRNAAFATGVFCLIFGVSFYAVFYAFYGTRVEYINTIITSSLVNGLTIGLIAALWNGGFDIVQHYILRYILYVKGFVPPGNYATFLDYASDRSFLSRIGGGYRFTHLTFRDYFSTKKHYHKIVPQSKTRIIIESGKFIIPVILAIVLVYSQIPRFVYLLHQKPPANSAIVYQLEVGDNITKEDGILFEDISIAPGDKVFIQANWWMDTGNFVTWVSPAGTAAGFMGFPISNTWDIPNIPPGTLHGALLYRISGEDAWHRTGFQTEFCSNRIGSLQMMINGIEYQKYLGHYYVTAHIYRNDNSCVQK